MAKAKKALPKFPMPKAKIPPPEPPQQVEDDDWRKAVEGSPELPVKNPDGTWSAGGLVRFTLCVDEDNNPRCYYCNADMTCSGPPNEKMRMSMTSCVAYRPRHGR